MKALISQCVPCVPSTKAISVLRCSGYQLPLIERFYKSCGLRVHCSKNEQVFGARSLCDPSRAAQSPWLAAVRFVPIGEQYWLMRNVCVAEAHRRKGLAGQLLAQALASITPAVCFCYAQRHLSPLYSAMGFQLCLPQAVPDDIANDYLRYLKHRKDLLLFAYGHR